MTMEPLPEDWERALAIVAHPDDLEYGAASAVARWTAQGKTVSYLLASHGEAGIDSMEPGETARVRAEEERRSAAVVGVDTVEFLDHRDGIIEYGLELRRDFARAIRQYRPEIIVTINFELTWGGVALNMADHRNVGLAVLDAARDAGNRWIFPELNSDGLEPWNGVRMVCVGASSEATHYVDVSDTIDLGVASLREHEAYLNNLRGGAPGADPTAFLREQSAAVGERCGCAHAVSFRVIQV